MATGGNKFLDTLVGHYVFIRTSIYSGPLQEGEPVQFLDINLYLLGYDEQNYYLGIYEDDRNKAFLTTVLPISKVEYMEVASTEPETSPGLN